MSTTATVEFIGNGNLNSAAARIRREAAERLGKPISFLHFGDALKLAAGKRKQIRDRFGARIGSEASRINEEFAKGGLWHPEALAEKLGLSTARVRSHLTFLVKHKHAENMLEQGWYIVK